MTKDEFIHKIEKIKNEISKVELREIRSIQNDIDDLVNECDDVDTICCLINASDYIERALEQITHNYKIQDELHDAIRCYMRH